MAGIVIVDTLQADSASTLVLKNGVASTPPTVQDSAGTQIGTFCRAWINFDGSAVTNPASMTGVRGSFNISSVLDNGAGDYTINFTTAMPDTNYCTVTSSRYLATSSNQILIQNVKSGGTYSTSAVQVISTSAIGSNTGMLDVTMFNVAIFR
jgi:hypothetical protein